MLSRLFKIAVALMIIMSPFISLAAELSIDTHTYYFQKEDETGSVARDIGTLYEYLSLDVSVDNISFVFSGWGKAELMDIRIGYENYDRYDGDFSAAYIEYTGDNNNFNLRLGRQSVLGHGSYESLSGISFRTDLPYNFRLSGYSGTPEELEENSEKEDHNLLSGGRLSLGVPGVLELGGSYLEEVDDKVQARREVGADLWLKPFKMLELYGETITNRIAENTAYSSVQANIYVTDNMTLSGTYEVIDYESYFERSELNVFNFYTLDDDLKTTSGILTYKVNDNLSISIDGKDYTFDTADGGSTFGGGIKLIKGDITSELSYHATDLEDVNKSDFTEYRLYMMNGSEDGIRWSLDGMLDLFDKKINGTDSSVTVIASAGYPVSDDFSVSVDLDYSSTPNYDEDYKMFARVEYKFGTNFDYTFASEEEEAAEEEEVKEEKEEIKTEEEPEVPAEEKTAPVPAIVPVPAPAAEPAPAVAPIKKEETMPAVPAPKEEVAPVEVPGEKSEIKEEKIKEKKDTPAEKKYIVIDQ